MFSYLTFGLYILSDLELPELEASRHDSVDVRVVLKERLSAGEQLIDGLAVQRGEDLDLEWIAAGRFRIKAGHTVEIYPTPDAPLALLNLPLLGPVLAALLHKRGLLVLHANVIDVNGNGLAITGDKGAGKSTLSAALLRSGYSLVSDDVAVIEGGPGALQPVFLPGYPRMKLTPATASAVEIPGSVFVDKPLEAFPKLLCDVSSRFRSKRVMARVLLVLSRGPDAQIERLAPQLSMQALLRAAYMPMRKHYVWSPDEKRMLFTQCATLATNMLVFRLSTRDGLEFLDEGVRLVEAAARTAEERNL